jgi:hypothetical protein
LAKRFILAAVFSLSVVSWIDILDTARELSGAAAEVTHRQSPKHLQTKTGVN